MPRIYKIEFDDPATINELIEGLEDLRAHYGNDAVVRVTVVPEISMKGVRVKAVTADRMPS